MEAAAGVTPDLVLRQTAAKGNMVHITRLFIIGMATVFNKCYVVSMQTTQSS